MEYIEEIIGLTVLLILSAFFSASETAYSALNPAHLGHSRESRLAKILVSEYDRLLVVILIGNNVVNIAMASLGAVFVGDLMDNDNAGALVSSAVMTVIILIFGEISPKSLVKKIPETFAVFAAPFLWLLIWLLRPLSFLFDGWSRLLDHLLKTSGRKNDRTTQLGELLSLMQQQGRISGADAAAIREILR